MAEEDQGDRAARRTAERRRRLAEVFGDPMPETTADERDLDAARETERGDTRLRDQVPPHHGTP